MRHLMFLPLVSVVAACDVRIACEADGDCPAAQPFCVARFCAAVDDGDEGEGEEGEGDEGEGDVGEGEGEGVVCGGDVDCGGGLCWLDAELAPDLVGQCLPGAGETVACAGSTPSRSATGPALAVVSLARGALCTPGPEVSYTANLAWRDADGDVDDSGFGLRVTAPGGPGGFYDVLWDTSTGITGTGGTGTTQWFFCAYPDVEQLGLQLFDDDEDGSNVVCVAP